VVLKHGGNNSKQQDHQRSYETQESSMGGHIISGKMQVST
jgi:hypothetical protein